MAIILNSLLADIAVVIATGFVMLYVYYANIHQYWKRRGVHYVKPTMIFGNLRGVFFQKENFGEVVSRVYQSNPNQPAIGIFAAKKPILVVRDLNLVRNVLVKDAHAFLDRPIDMKNNMTLGARNLFVLKGKKWRHMRVKLTPTFTSGKIKNMFYLINNCGKELVNCIEKEMAKGKSFVVKDTVARYSTDVIASCAFGINANALADPNCEFRATMRKVFEPTNSQKFVSYLSIFAPWLRNIYRKEAVNNEVYEYVRRTFWDVAEHREKNGVARKDFVDILMKIKHEGEVQAEDSKDAEEIKQDSKYINLEKLKTDKSDIRLEDDDFAAQAFVFILAGFETSSSVITFALYELARNPAIQDRLRQEVQTVLDKNNSEVTYEAIADMTYLEMVVSETLRKYPTVPQVERKCLQDYKIPGSEITIEKGTHVTISVLGIHWDPAIYPEPDRFDPERFTPENKSKRPSFTHIPFGEGPRICIGMRFGQMQVKTALVHILTSYQVQTCVETPQPPLGIKPFSNVNAPKKDIVLAFSKLM